jgi:hypothetical protein
MDDSNSEFGSAKSLSSVSESMASSSSASASLSSSSAVAGLCRHCINGTVPESVTVRLGPRSGFCMAAGDYLLQSWPNHPCTLGFYDLDLASDLINITLGFSFVGSTLVLSVPESGGPTLYEKEVGNTAQDCGTTVHGVYSWTNGPCPRTVEVL